MKSKLECGRCVHFQANALDLSQGECRKSAATVIGQINTPQGPQLISGWPTIKREGWCSEFDAQHEKDKSMN